MSRSHTAIMLLVAFLVAVWHIQLGRIPVDLWAWLSGAGQLPEVQQLILSELRLPRLLLALSVGATLGLAGAALQGLLRNPLAGPGLVGVTNFAALGAVIALYLGLAAVSWWALPIGGMLGASLAVVFIFVLAGRSSSTLSLILAGVAVNALAGSCISLVLNFSDNPYAMSEIVFWLLGSLANRSMQDVGFAMPFMLVGSLLLLASKNFLDALSFGEETAQTMGYRVARYRWLIVFGVALSVGAAVSVSGNIGFVGLVIPHLLRPWVKHRPGALLPASALGGALFLMLADCVVQVVPGSQELKLGVVTALVGGPFFLHLIVRMRGEYR